MKTLSSYKGYQGTFKFSEHDNVYHGTIQNINGTVTYEADKAEDLQKAFEEAVDDYINDLKKFEDKQNSLHRHTLR